MCIERNSIILVGSASVLYIYTKITLSVCFDIRASSISLLSIDVIREESSVNTGSITLVAFDDVFHYSIFVL